MLHKIFETETNEVMIMTSETIFSDPDDEFAEIIRGIESGILAPHSPDTEDYRLAVLDDDGGPIPGVSK